MVNKWITEDDRKSGAPNGDRDRLGSGKTAALEQDFNQL
jgi:hypothetical protein